MPASPPQPVPRPAVKKETPALFSQVMDTKLSAQQQRIMKINSQYLTLQLMASHHLKSVQTFINQKKLQSTTMIYKTNIKGESLYIVIYGAFPTRVAAETTMKQLKAQNISAFIKSYAAVKKEIQGNSSAKK
jgi:septal ring-binding cell division protein DamX